MKKASVFLVVAVVTCFLLPYQAQALSVAGYTFDDEAFADYLYSASGNPATFTYGVGFNYSPTFAEIETSVIGDDLINLAILDSNDTLTLGFSDNLIVNGVGTDFVIFEMNAVEGGYVDVQLLGLSQAYYSVWTGYDNGFGTGGNINAVEVDLSNFGLAMWDTVDLISVTGMTNFDLAAIGALNSQSIPDPSVVFLLGSACLIGFAGARRKFKE